MSDQWTPPQRDLPPDVQADVNERGARSVWRELEKHGITRSVHKPDCTCHGCATKEDR